MERSVGGRQTNPSGRSDEPVEEPKKTTPDEMGDRAGNDHSSSGRTHPAVRQKQEHRKDQIQWHRIRSNKVGVEEGAVSIDVVKEVDDRGCRSPVPCPLSAKLRSGSGSSQFREVDFSDQVQEVGRSTLDRPHYFVSDSLKYGGPEGFTRQPSIEVKLVGDKGEQTEHDPKEGRDESGTNKDNAHNAGDDDDKQELRILKNGDEVGRITVIKGKVQVTEGPNGNQDGANKPGDGTDGVVTKEGACVGLDGAIEIGGGGIGILAQEFDNRGWDNEGNMVRRVVQVPQSLVLKDDYPRFSTAASTSQVRIPHYQASTDSFTTGATEISSGSTRGGTTTTAAEGDEEAPKSTRPIVPAQDEQEKPTLTPTSLAIYSSIQQQGSSRSGTCILFSTAVCTFIVTLVLTVAILIAPKTLASRGQEDQAARAAPALTTTTTNNNTSDTGASHAALHANTLTRILSSVLAPTPPTPNISSIPTTSATTSAPTIFDDSQNATELSGDALRTR
ncbi:uncharacterized protein [Panulirus ornatus]|uniref:uncharacterized protein n=1 Tax=Panulirus ornatus TaxID=150431 RepID=UPI003A855711